jgi:hypothetical protein
VNSTLSLLNCTFTENHSESGKSLLKNDGPAPAITNCIIWGNRNAGSDLPQEGGISSTTEPIYSHSLVQNLDLSTRGTNNLDGTDPDNNPRFADILFGPTGYLASGQQFSRKSASLHSDSPLFDRGDGAANTTQFDQKGLPRKVGPIDLGSQEHQGFLYVDCSRQSGSNDGSSWENAFQFLQDALTASTKGQAILVAKGTYYPDEGNNQNDGSRSATFQLESNRELYGGFPAGGGDFSERNPANNTTILCGDIDQNDVSGKNKSDNSYTVLTASCDVYRERSLIDGFVIQNGNANSDFDSFPPASPTASGGGLVTCNYPLLVENCYLLNNSAKTGGAAFVGSGARSPTFINTIFQKNTASFFGGALYQTAGSLFINCTFQGNLALERGHILFNDRNQQNEFVNCILWDNGDPKKALDSRAGSPLDLRTSKIGFSLVQGYSTRDLIFSGSGNLDGTQSFSNPFATTKAGNSNQPELGQDLRLHAQSPAINRGFLGINQTAFDFLGNSRVQGDQIDLGALEAGSLNLDYLFQTDLDQDGVPFGLEWAIGTDPAVDDRKNSRHLQAPLTNPSGESVVTFGYNPNLPDNVTLKLMRATSLKPDEFTVVAEITPSRRSYGLWEIEDTGMLLEPNKFFNYIDRNSPQPRAFYRLQAEYEGDGE